MEFPGKFLIFLAVIALTVDVSLQGANEARLRRNLFKGYSVLERPVSNDSEALTVQLGLTLNQIMDVDEKNQVLTTNIWLQLHWNDTHLQWDPSEYPGVDNLRLPYDYIWKPDILLYNNADERFDTTYHTNTLVSPTGFCTYMPPGIFKSSCQIDMRWFPFDVQRCELKFGSWTYGGWSIDLKMVEADTSNYIANGEWDLVEVPGKKNVHVYECCEEPYHDVTYTVVMRRRTLYYGLNLLLPCVLISILALLVFLLPADSGEKITLGVTVLLALTVFMLLVADIMPPTSDSVPLIAQYFATIMVIVGLSVMATVVVLQFHHHDPNGSKMPEWIRVFLLNWCAGFLRMKHPGESRVSSACHDKAPHGSLTTMELSATSPDPGAQYGRLLDSPVKDETHLLAGHASSVGSIELAKILDEVRHISKRFRDQDENRVVCNDWKFAASVIDRLCLIAFSLVTILCTLGILLSAPNL